MIQISKLSKYYAEKMALENIYFDIRGGLIFGLLGLSGSGKTTLISILNGLEKIDGGDVRVFGIDPQTHREALRSISAIIPKEFAFYSNLSVKENLDFFSKLQNANTKSYERAVNVNELDSLLDVKAADISQAQKRRLNVAIALLGNPRVLYFDEPTEGLDLKNSQELFEMIKKYKELGITIVYATQYVSQVEEICDEVAIFKDGYLVEKNSIGNLISNESSTQVFVEVVYKFILDNLELNMINQNTIETTNDELFTVIRVLESNGVPIKQIRYGGASLEEHFFEIAGNENVKK